LSWMRNRVRKNLSSGSPQCILALKGRTKFLLMFLPISIVAIPVTILMVLEGECLAALAPAFLYLFASALLYDRYIRGRKPRYPLAYPGRERDPYFPWSDIPRPVYEDVREHPDFFEKRKRDDEKRRG